MTELKDETFEEEVINADKLVLVDFFATWCGPCRMLAPTIDDIADDYGDKLKVCKADVDLMPKTSLDYKIMSVPTLILFKNGTAVGKMIGVSDYDEIADMIDNNI